MTTAERRRDATLRVAVATLLAAVVAVWPELCGALGVALGGAACVRGRA